MVYVTVNVLFSCGYLAFFFSDSKVENSIENSVLYYETVSPPSSEIPLSLQHLGSRQNLNLHHSTKTGKILLTPFSTLCRVEYFGDN